MTLQEYSENIKKLNHYTELYDAGTPEISDEEWDSLYFDCCQFEQENKYVDPKSPSNSIQFDIKNSLRNKNGIMRISILRLRRVALAT